MRRIGIDVGGTNTDAVLIEDGKVVRAMKAPTSEDVTTGILDSIKSLGSTGVLKGKRIDGVMIGTTHFINAVVQRRHLTKVAALRLGMPASASLPPFCDWPEDLAELVRGGVWMVEGGHEYDGRPFMPLDEAAVTRAAQEMKEAGLKSVAISSIFSPLDPSHERRAAELVAAVIPDAAITCSSDLGRIGLLERENAGLLNAALADLVARHHRRLREGDPRIRHRGTACSSPRTTARWQRRARRGACRSIPSPRAPPIRCAAPPISRAWPTPW